MVSGIVLAFGRDFFPGCDIDFEGIDFGTVAFFAVTVGADFSSAANMARNCAANRREIGQQAKINPTLRYT
jgi:hypothetical protein